MLSIVTIFTIQAAVTIVTAGLAVELFGFTKNISIMSLFNFTFSLVQMDCQIEISKGAGIQPRKAAKKTIPETSIGNI